MKEDGTYLSGFKGVGRYLNPVVAKEVFCSRVSQNLEELPLSFYFIDCDAAGEIHEDYNPLHPTTSEESQKARMMRLRWLREEKKLAVGSEGGDPFTLPEILVSEGAFAPTFGWEDPDFSDKDSDYYIGGYWPPEAPEGFFRETPLKDYLVKRYYDPSTRIPLLETIFHDSVAITNQWGSGMYKFKEGKNVLELLEMLYLNPPLYNMNRERLEEKREDLIHNYQFFSPLHEKYGFEELLSFQWLTEDRLIQKTTYGNGLTMVANFSDNPFIYSDCELKPYSVAAYINDEYYGSFAPLGE